MNEVQRAVVEHKHKVRREMTTKVPASLDRVAWEYRYWNPVFVLSTNARFAFTHERNNVFVVQVFVISQDFAAETGHEMEGNLEWHYDYSTVVGFFRQDVARPISGTVDAIEEDFGLVEQEYDTDKLLSDCGRTSTQWQRFDHKLKFMNQIAPIEVTYRLLYLGRHGQGYHNVGIMFYGDVAWDCHYGAFDRDPNVPSIIYLDARLTSLGRYQARAVSKAWQNSTSTQGMPLPQTYYSSPLTRSMQTAQITFSSLALPPSQVFRPVVKEFLREGYGIQSCDLRPTKSYIQANFPEFQIEDSFTDNDELHSPIYRESLQHHDRRVRALLDDVFAHDESRYISMTSHSGTIEATLRVVGHSALSLPPGGVVPVLVRVRKVSGKRHDEEDEKEWETKPVSEFDLLETGRECYKDIAKFLDEIDRSVPQLEEAVANE